MLKTEAPPLHGKTIFTIGHSTRSIEEFLELLKYYDITVLVDVRSYPFSRRNPQFNSELMKKSLQLQGIDYVHIAGLGGLRKPRTDSVNQAWRNLSFRGYADYMQSDDFKAGLSLLLKVVKKEKSSKVAVMCAEAVPWRCHRFLLSDALCVRGFNVEHILGKGSTRRHEVPKWAKIQGEELSYPAADPEQAKL